MCACVYILGLLGEHVGGREEGRNNRGTGRRERRILETRRPKNGQ